MYKGFATSPLTTPFNLFSQPIFYSKRLTRKPEKASCRPLQDLTLLQKTFHVSLALHKNLLLLQRKNLKQTYDSNRKTSGKAAGLMASEVL